VANSIRKTPTNQTSVPPEGSVQRQIRSLMVPLRSDWDSPEAVEAAQSILRMITAESHLSPADMIRMFASILRAVALVKLHALGGPRIGAVDVAINKLSKTYVAALLPPRIIPHWKGEVLAQYKRSVRAEPPPLDLQDPAAVEHYIVLIALEARQELIKFPRTDETYTINESQLEGLCRRIGKRAIATLKGETEEEAT
jgi:hypothetical protein